MKSNVKVKINESNLKKTISKNDLNFKCPKCQYELTVKLNQSSVVCPNCNTNINLQNTLVDDITKAFKDVFK